MRTALLASTVTPGSTAPVVSLTRPAMLLACCCADAGETTSVTETTSIRQTNLDVVTDRISITDDGLVPQGKQSMCRAGRNYCGACRRISTSPSSLGFDPVPRAPVTMKTS